MRGEVAARFASGLKARACPGASTRLHASNNFGALLLATCLLLSACSRDAQPPASEPAAGGNEVAAADSSSPPTISNKVWVVSRSSSVAAGTMYTFLSDGTLLITSPWSTPALGQWRQNGDELVFVEEGIDYRVEVLGQTSQEFRVRIHNPGTPAEITFVPAESVDPPG